MSLTEVTVTHGVVCYSKDDALAFGHEGEHIFLIDEDLESLTRLNCVREVAKAPVAPKSEPAVVAKKAKK